MSLRPVLRRSVDGVHGVHGKASTAFRRVASVPGSLKRRAPGVLVAASPNARIQIVNAEQLQAAIGTRRERPIVVDFFATWCGPCLLLAQELEKVSAELGDGVDIYKLDVDAKDNQELSTSLQIQGLPTMLFISPNDQKPVLRTEGLLPADTIKNIIKQEL